MSGAGRDGHTTRGDDDPAVARLRTQGWLVIPPETAADLPPEIVERVNNLLTQPTYVRLGEAATRLGVSHTTAQQWYDNGTLRGRRLFARKDRMVEVASIREVEALLAIPVEALQEAALLDLRRKNWEQKVETVEASPPGPARDQALAELHEQRPE